MYIAPNRSPVTLVSNNSSSIGKAYNNNYNESNEDKSLHNEKSWSQVSEKRDNEGFEGESVPQVLIRVSTYPAFWLMLLGKMNLLMVR